jgi:hypothetical protein
MGVKKAKTPVCALGLGILAMMAVEGPIGASLRLVAFFEFRAG